MIMSKKTKVLFYSTAICCLLLAGCDSSARRDAADERNPQVQKGLEQAQLKRWDEAIRHFEAALSGNAELARPDLELALIYHQQNKDYVRAIYHYERYLEKRPESEKYSLIQGWINQAKISLVAEIGQQTGGISEELLRLTRENNMLRKQLAGGAGTAPSVTKARAIRTQPPPARKPAPKPAPVAKVDQKPTPVSAKPVERIQIPAPTSGTYKVLPGDTLTRIAKAVYGDGSRWKDIYAANRDKMQNENDLKAGQTIIIPKL